MNGDRWHIKVVAHNNPLLVDRTGNARVAVTDPGAYAIYISAKLPRSLLPRVLIHELGHCAIVSFGLAYDIHKMVRQEFWIEAEEWVCNFIADYGFQIFTILHEYLGDEAWRQLPHVLETLIKKDIS